MRVSVDVCVCSHGALRRSELSKQRRAAAAAAAGRAAFDPELKKKQNTNWPSVPLVSCFWKPDSGSTCFRWRLRGHRKAGAADGE